MNNLTKTIEQLNKMEKKLVTLNKEMERYYDLELKLRSEGRTGEADFANMKFKEFGAKVEEMEAKVEKLKKSSNDVLAGFNNQIAASTQLASKFNVDISSIVDRLNTFKSAMDSAFAGGNYKDADLVLQNYIKEIEILNKTVIAASATELNSQNDVLQSIESTTDAQRRLNEEYNNYLSNTKFNVNKMSYAEQTEYYTQMLNQFSQGTEEYAKVLELLNNAQRNAAEESRRMVGSIVENVQSMATRINSAVNKIIDVMRTALTALQKWGSAYVKIFNTIKSGVTGIIQLFGNLANRVRGIFDDGSNSGTRFSGILGQITSSATELRNTILLIAGAFDKLFNNEAIRKAKELFASIYSLTVIGNKQTTQDIIDWAESYEKLFGLSARNLIADLNELSGVFVGLGIKTSDLKLASTNILIMAQSMAAFGAAGGDADAVLSKLISGIKGYTQSVDDLGISVRNAEMNNFIAKMKEAGRLPADFANNFRNLNEEARIYIRLASIIDQFTNAYNWEIDAPIDELHMFEKSLESTTGIISILHAQFSNMMTVIGQGFLNLYSVVARYLIPIISVLTQYIKRAFEWLYNFLGLEFKMDIDTDINGAVDGLGSVEDALEDVNDELDETSSKAKKAAGNLQSFDRVNNVTTPSSSDSGSDLSKRFNYSDLLKDMLAGLNKKAEDATEGFIDYLLDELKKKIEELWRWLKDLTGRENFNLGFDWPTIKENIINIISGVWDLIKKWGTFTLTIALKIADDLNIGAIITALTTLVSHAVNLANTISDILIPAFNNFYDIALAPIVRYIGERVLGTIERLTESLDSWSDWFHNNDEEITLFFENLARVVNSVWTAIEPLFDLAWDWLDGKISSITKSLQNLLLGNITDFNENVDDIEKNAVDKATTFANRVSTIVEVLSGNISDETQAVLNADAGNDVWLNFIQILYSIKVIAGDVKDIIGQLLEDLGKWTKEDGLPWLNEKLQELADWFSENKDQIVTTLEKIAGFVWDSFKDFVDLVGKLIDFIVQHPNEVILFLTGLTAIKIGSWALDSAKGLITLIGSLKLFGAIKGLKSLTTLAGGGALATGGGALATGGALTGTQTLGSLTAIGTANGLGGAGLGAAAAGSGSWLGGLVAGNVAKSSLGALGMAELPFMVAGTGIVTLVRGLKDTFENYSLETGELNTNITRMRDVAYRFYESAVDLANEQGKDISEYKDLILETYQNYLESTGQYTESQVSGYMSEFSKRLDEEYNQGTIALGNSIRDKFYNVTNDTNKFSDDLKENIKGMMLYTESTLGDTVESSAATLDYIINSTNQSLDEISAANDAYNSSLNENTQGTISSLDDIINSVTEYSDGYSTVMESIADATNQTHEGVSQTLDEIVNCLNETGEESYTLADIIGENITAGVDNGIDNGKETTLGIIGGFASSLIDKVKEIFGIHSPSTVFEGVGDNIVAGLLKGIEDAWSNLKLTVSNLCGGLVDDMKLKLQGAWDTASGWISEKISDFTSNFSIASRVSSAITSVNDAIASSVSSHTSASYAQGVISTNAIGGSIAGGQLFIANENGDAELIGNIDGTGKTNVANNQMIINAMRDGVFEAVYNAMAEVRNQSTMNRSASTGSNIKIDGFGLIDASTLTKLARMLAPYLNSNARNIADVNFTI